MKKKLFIVVNVEWFFLSHRLPIALEAQKKGYDVTIFATEEKGQGPFIEQHGLKFVKLPTTRSGTNIITEIRVLFFLYHYYKKYKPDIVHHVAVKPVTYGSIAAKLSKVPRVINALSGLGFLFINAEKNKWLHRIVTSAFKYGFKNPNIRFILQNHDDYNLIKSTSLLKEDQLCLIKGSGVDLSIFAYSEIPKVSPVVVLLPARMLWDKGVGEFVLCAQILKKKYKQQVHFVLAGESDVANKSGIEKAQLEQWNKEGDVEWIGHQSDIMKWYQNAHIIVLPSYREGLPKSLIEACAIGRPIVTTDVPGCREVVTDGENGFLVPQKDFLTLAEKIEILINNPDFRIEMGKKGRLKAEKEFSIENVIEKTLELYN